MSLFPKSAITDNNLVNTSAVKNTTPASNDYGLVVRPINTDPDNFNTNSNLQVANADVSNANPVPVSIVSGGGGSGSIQYNEDTPHTSGDTGTMALSVRNDTPSSLANTNGDYTPLQTGSNGSLWVKDENSNNILTKLTDIETNTDSLTQTGGGTEAGALRVTLANDSTGLLSVDDNGGSLTVDANNLDIRDLTFATDKVDVSGSSVSVSNFPANQNVIATDLDIRNLTPTQDKVSIGDGTDTLGVNADGSINVNATISNQLENPVISRYVVFLAPGNFGPTGPNYTIDDYIQKIDFYDDSRTLVNTIWYNQSTNTVIPAPSLNHINTIEQIGALYLPALDNLDIPVGDFRSDVEDFIGLTNSTPYTSSDGSVSANLNSLLKGLNLRPKNGTTTTFTATTSTTIQSANDNRKGMMITNEGAGDLYILLGTGTASTTNYSAKITPNSYWELPFKFTGDIKGIFASAGTARITILT